MLYEFCRRGDGLQACEQGVRSALALEGGEFFCEPALVAQVADELPQVDVGDAGGREACGIIAHEVAQEGSDFQLGAGVVGEDVEGDLVAQPVAGEELGVAKFGPDDLEALGEGGGESIAFMCAPY